MGAGLARAFIDLLESDLPAAADRWFVDGGDVICGRSETRTRR
ncbi:MAG TPA: hypothetical protein VG253_19030 [Streptosporangiaceae bacterium]|jgi:hypothetical protein|nr:hypothetical protein [Streptosporangiaceae bacterium]